MRTTRFLHVVFLCCMMGYAFVSCSEVDVMPVSKPSSNKGQGLKSLIRWDATVVSFSPEDSILYLPLLDKDPDAEKALVIHYKVKDKITLRYIKVAGEQKDKHGKSLNYTGIYSLKGDKPLGFVSLSREGEFEILGWNEQGQYTQASVKKVMREIKELWQQVDDNLDGKVRVEEFRQALVSTRASHSLQLGTSILDINADGWLDYQEAIFAISSSALEDKPSSYIFWGVNGMTYLDDVTVTNMPKAQIYPVFTINMNVFSSSVSFPNLFQQFSSNSSQGSPSSSANNSSPIDQTVGGAHPENIDLAVMELSKVEVVANFSRIDIQSRLSSLFGRGSVMDARIIQALQEIINEYYEILANQGKSPQEQFLEKATAKAKALSATAATTAFKDAVNKIKLAAKNGNEHSTTLYVDPQTGQLKSSDVITNNSPISGKVNTSIPGAIGDIHNHPNNRLPSHGDIYGLIKANQSNGGYDTRVVLNSNVTYAVVVVDAAMASAFTQICPPDVGINGQNFPDELMNAINDAELRFEDLGYSNFKVMALQYGFQQFDAGLSLMMQDSQGNFTVVPIP